MHLNNEIVTLCGFTFYEIVEWPLESDEVELIIFVYEH
jgi:hypothetical protein